MPTKDPSWSRGKFRLRSSSASSGLAFCTLISSGGTFSRPKACAILGLLARFASSAIGTDIDLDSVLVANENARKNHVSGFTALHVTGANTPRIRQGGPYDTVFANILMRPLIGLAPDIASLTAPGGTIILSGLLHHQAPPVRNAFASRGLDFQTRIREDGWSTLVFRKPGQALQDQ